MAVTFLGSVTASGPYTADATATLAGVGSTDVQFAWLDCLENNTRTVAGWTLIGNVQLGTTLSDYHHAALYWRRGPGTFTAPVPSTSSQGAWLLGIVAYSGLIRAGNPYQSAAVTSTASPSTRSAPSATVSTASTALRLWAAVGTNATATGTTERVTSYTAGLRDVITIGDDPVAPPTAAAKTPGTYNGGLWVTGTVVLAPYTNTPPNAPIPTAPTGTVDRTQPIPLQATFSDPDPGDSPSASQWRYRIRDVGAAWTTVSQPNPLQSYTIPAGLAAGDYEWQAAYADQAGEWGPFCSSAFFTATTPPAGPVWLHPTSGETIGADSYTGQISTPSLSASEWTLYADNAGTISSTVLQGPVTVSTGDLRSHTFTGLANNTPVWWSVRTQDAGLWSQPVAVRTPVSFTPPPVASSTATPVPAEGAIDVAITNPAPSGGQPAAAYNNIWFAEPGEVEKRRATFVSPNSTWRHWGPTKGVVYAYRIETVASNGTTSTSAPTP